MCNNLFVRKWKRICSILSCYTNWLKESDNLHFVLTFDLLPHTFVYFTHVVIMHYVFLYLMYFMYGMVYGVWSVCVCTHFTYIFCYSFVIFIYYYNNYEKNGNVWDINVKTGMHDSAFLVSICNIIEVILILIECRTSTSNRQHNMLWPDLSKFFFFSF